MIKQGGLFARFDLAKRARTGKIVAILVLMYAGFFCFLEICQSAGAGDVVINEVAWMGTAVSANDEWIELRNMTDSEISLAGWILAAADGTPTINLSGSIPANSYFLLERTDDNSMPDVTADQIYTGALANGGEVLQLYDGDGNLIDSVNASGGWPAGDNANKLTMERTGNGDWQNSGNVEGTPRSPNAPASANETLNMPNEESERVSNESGIKNEKEAEFSMGNSASLGDVVINEFVSDPTDNDVEWIELYNTTNQAIDLIGWTIEEGSGAQTELKSVITNNTFLVIEKPKGNLNNKGDIIILRDSIGTLIDQVVYGNWNSNINSKAPVACDPYSVGRKFDGYNSFNNANDFAVTITPTKGASNVITENTEEYEDAKIMNNYDYSNDIIISEIFPNPIGNDRESEFIELYNKGDRDINLIGWSLGDNSKKRYELSTGALTAGSFGTDAFQDDSVIIKAKEYLAIYRNESKIALNNSGDSVKLYQPLMDEPSQVVEYEKAIEDWSYNLNEEFPSKAKMKSYELGAQDYDYVWSEVVTPGRMNIIKTINHAPIVDFDCPEEILFGIPVMFDGSDTIDEDGDELKFFWDFGDGFTNELVSPEHTFFKQGVWTVKLTVGDGKNEAVKEKIVKVEGEIRESRLQQSAYNDSIIINEFLPNPEGSDSDGEFIELYNQGSGEVNLINWQIDDSEEGSKPYTFDIDLWLGSGRYYVLERAESGLVLNNAIDAVRLFNNLNELVEEIEYEQAVGGEAYARGRNGKWFWTTVATPGEENIISVAKNEEFPFGTDQLLAEGIMNYELGKGNKKKKIFKKVKQIIKTTLAEVRECEVGDLVKVAGIVAVKPGILGSQYFYIVGSPGIQVYNYKKDFPNLEIGDYVEVTGELSISRGEQRLKTKQADDIKIIERRQPPTANKATCERINEDYVGQLITVTGEVVERKSSVIYLDDGTDEVVIYIKKATGINPKSIKEGEIIQVTGLVSRTKTGIRIMPRSPDDIIKKDSESRAGVVGQVLGEVSVSDEWEIVARDKKLELFKYLLVVASAVTVVLTGLLIRQVKRG